jgi:hypothetical protein
MDRKTFLAFVAGALSASAALQALSPTAVVTERNTVLELLSFEGRLNSLPDGGTLVDVRACGHKRVLAPDGGLGELRSEPCWRSKLAPADVTVERLTLEGAKLLKKEE